jgi:AcrR family transcriptional regulator
MTALDVIGTVSGMPRWEPDAVGRLQAAALDLFALQGFDNTTIAQIAERAGLTKRTFFNHFADKRDVLSGARSERQREIVAREMIATTERSSPLDTVVRGLQAAAEEMFEGRRDDVRRRQDVIDANPELHERELQKRAALSDALAEALDERGLSPDTARLAARVGMLVQETAMRQWMQAGDDRPLREYLAEALRSLRTIVGQSPVDNDAPGRLG